MLLQLRGGQLLPTPSRPHSHLKLCCKVLLQHVVWSAGQEVLVSWHSRLLFLHGVDLTLNYNVASHQEDGLLTYSKAYSMLPSVLQVQGCAATACFLQSLGQMHWLQALDLHHLEARGPLGSAVPALNHALVKSLAHCQSLTWLDISQWGLAVDEVSLVVTTCLVREAP